LLSTNGSERREFRFTRSPQTVGLFRSTYGRDPDGNIFELQEVRDPRHPVALENLLPDLGK
jgi:hypothetical protein